MYCDVESNYWASGVIKYLSAKHVIEGIAQDKFAPEAGITRQEMA
ncbi:S-layer homology domain-containing protein, partial [Paenibacillus maysiensis]